MTDPLIDPLIEQLERLSADYPIPDPAWDYADIWKQAVTLQRAANALVELLQQTEDATPESDRLVQFYLNTIRNNVNAAFGDSHTSYLLDQDQGGVYRVDRDR